MKFTLCAVALTIMVSVDAVPATAIELPATDPGFFKKKLDSVQGAIKDSIRAGMDLQIMEGKLKAIVAASSFFWMTESATEYATAKNAYANGWKAGEPECYHNEMACTHAATYGACENGAIKPGYNGNDSVQDVIDDVASDYDDADITLCPQCGCKGD